MKNINIVSHDNMSVDVGRRLRELRSDRGLSIRALAEKSGLNVNTISLIENGKTSPSVSTLQQIATALELPINVFFQSETPPLRIVYQKAADRSEATIDHGKLADLGAGFNYPGLELFVVDLQPGANSGKTHIVHTGLEFVYCLEGSTGYEVNGQMFVLERGDSLLFEAYLPHRWRNAGETPSRFLLFTCPAAEREQPDERHFTFET